MQFHELDLNKCMFAYTGLGIVYAHARNRDFQLNKIVEIFHTYLAIGKVHFIFF
jgi:hypothetical protein